MRLGSMFVLVSLGGCVSQSAYDEVAAERDLLQQRVDELQKKASAKHTMKAPEGTYRTSMALRADEAKRVRAALELGPATKLKATFHTSLGDIHCELMPDVAPKTVENFVGLARGTKAWTDPKTKEVKETPLYSGTIFHRVIDKFMIQGGDPLGNGTGDPGYKFEDEVDPSVRFDAPGLLAMANSGRDTNGSQFFITDSQPKHLNMKHTIFGRCGDPEVVKKIMAAPRGAGHQASTPVTPIVLNNVEITTEG